MVWAPSTIHFYGRPSIDRSVVDDIADEVATTEAMRLDDGSAVDNATHDRGNYTVETLMRALSVTGDLACGYWVPKPSSTPSPVPTILAGNGSHWIAIIRLNDI